MNKENIIIFDTTLRDGEQSPGASMNIEEKIQLAIQLEKLGVDVIEAGFAAASKGDFKAIYEISQRLENSVVCSLARAIPSDIEVAIDSVKLAKKKRIHTFIATSPIHMEFKLKMKTDEVIKRAVEAVKLAKSEVCDVEFSAEDAGRSELSFLKEIFDEVIKAGASTINVPDTVGYRLPFEMGELIRELKEFIANRAIISVHNHNDLGLACANSIYCIENGARQVECTINGLGERAGNASLEEFVMILNTRKDIFSKYYTNINIKEIYPSSRLVTNITGIEPQPNKAIVGKNAFAHESGIHQDGVLKHQETYEIMKASDIGLDSNSLVLGKHSGRHAFKDKIRFLGFDLDTKSLDEAFLKFKNLADSKKEVFDEDIRALIANDLSSMKEYYSFEHIQISDTSNGFACAIVSLRFDNEVVTKMQIGNGVIDAIFKAIEKITCIQGKLLNYKVDSVSKGKDSLARVNVKVMFNDKDLVSGHGLDLDTVQASAKAYINSLNNYMNLHN